MITIKKYINQVCYIEIDRPDKKNALAKSTIEKLIDFFKTSANSTQFNVLVLSGSNGFFSAGADLGWMKEGMKQSDVENLEDAQLFNSLYHTMSIYPKPILAKVESGAYGGAIGLMACSDVVITSPDSLFKFSETALGLIPATVAPYIVKKIGNGNARYLLMSGNHFNGNDAFRYGLAHILVPNKDLEDTTQKTAEQISTLGPKALAKTKELLNYLDQKALSISPETQDYCASLIANARKLEESQERVTSFFKRNKSHTND
ncbi:MAG: enoyl-CoA hydratase-related protein [Dysgonamonadaceae bacterium]|nr:enoyl-CoA hydratase-related protein [Dysgonamonadaceae bacterium]MDD4729656.1 enoyl-CoA hydratase-related protein [Dysgonamonadaceae bacterium]